MEKRVARIDVEMPENKFCQDIAERLNEYYGDKEPKEKVYFAGPWFDDRALYLYNNVRFVLKKFSNLKVYFPQEHTATTPKKTFRDNVKNIQEADLIIALIDRKDTGTAWEIGLAQGLGKKILLVGIDEGTFKSTTNIMLAFCAPAILLKNLVSYLLTRDEKYLYHVKNTWEGKQ